MNAAEAQLVRQRDQRAVESALGRHVVRAEDQWAAERPPQPAYEAFRRSLVLLPDQPRRGGGSR